MNTTPDGRDASGPDGSRLPDGSASVLASLVPILAAFVALVFAVEILHHLPSRSVPSIAVSASGGRQLVRLRAPAGKTVAVVIFADSDAHATSLRTTGAEQTYVVPVAWSQAPWITASSCFINAALQCQGPTVNADDRPGG